jgi:LysM repeat protein
MTRRGRAVLMSLVTVPVVVILVALALNGGRAIAIGAGKSAPLQSVTVLSGQSLWQLAEHLAPKADPREVIADIVALNTLTSVDVQPGQKLDIPSQYSGR